jgi:hypothetical protein
VDECKYQIFKRNKEDPGNDGDVDLDETIIRNDILDNYYMFNKLEHYLHMPLRLRDQLLFQFDPTMGDGNLMVRLIEKYYEYNPVVMRELLNCNKRKDLDDICEKLNIKNIKSCRRQFDNLKRISRKVIDDSIKGYSLNKLIRDYFLLPPKMAE